MSYVAVAMAGYHLAHRQTTDDTTDSYWLYTISSVRWANNWSKAVSSSVCQ